MDPQPSDPSPQQDLSAFDLYPWQMDLVFLTGLIALLGGVDKLQPDPSHADLAVHARIFYYAKVSGVHVDYSAYKQWATDGGPDQKLLAALYWANNEIAKLETPPEQSLDHAVAMVAQQYVPPAPGPAWMQAAPSQPLQVAAGAGGGDAGAAPYPAHFAELIAAVQANKPVPGVREIPDTVVRDPDVKPVGKMAAPKKPWEVNLAPTGGQGEDGKQTVIEQDFPPVENAPENGREA